jgi:uncharacterized damage-inducible protein DinB
MKQTRIVLLLAVPIFTVAALGQDTKSAVTPTIASTIDREIGNVEKQVIEAAEAMSEDRYSFSPESLKIPGSDYKGVRTFAQQVKHIAASNYAIWSPLTGDRFPADFMGGNGPENLKTKAEILKFLKESFVLGHKAAATLTIQNMLEPAENSKSPRLRLATFGVAHAFDHYGQMVEYLRMSGIVPPVSRPSQPQSQAPLAARSRTEETLEWWNQIGTKLIAMAKDVPEDKYDFKVQKDQRTFAQNLLHVAAVDYLLIRKVSGSNIGPDFGKDSENPSRDVYRTKADVVKLLEQAVSDGAAVIKQQGDAGLDKTMQFGWETGKHVVHTSYIWMAGIEHSAEHFGQLVVYYRANNLVPPESRR